MKPSHLSTRKGHNMTPEPIDWADRVGEMVKAAGIDNFQFRDNMLVMCGVRYIIEQCECHDPGCNGLRLRRSAAMQ
jgi:hypothetical protein